MKYLFVAFSFLFALSAIAQTADKPLITTTGTATVYAPPDEILLNFTISTRSENIKETRRENAAISKKAIAFIKSKNIPEVHIQTQYVNLQPVYKKYSKTAAVNEIQYFEAKQSINICIKKLEDFDEIFDGLIELGVTRLGKPVFRNSEIKKYKDKARTKAIKAARSKAQLLAKALDQSIGKAFKIKENQGTPRFDPNSYSAVASSPEEDDNERMSFAPGQLEIRASVEVAFELD